MCAAAAGDCPRCLRRIGQCWQDNLIRIGKAALVAADGPDSHPLVYAVGAFPDDALFQHPRLGLGIFKIQVGVIDVIDDHLIQGFFDIPALNSGRVEQLPGGFFKLLAHNTLCSSAGNDCLSSCTLERSMSAQATPGPSSRLHRMSPHGSMIML